MAAPSGQCHLHYSCTGASNAVQWQRISTVLGENTGKPSRKPQNRDPLLEAEDTHSLTAEVRAKSLLQHWLSLWDAAAPHVFWAAGQWGALVGRDCRRMGKAVLADK